MRGHRYAGADFARDFARHFGGSVPKVPQTTTAPQKTDAEIQAEAAQARLDAQRRRGRRATALTTGGEPSAPTTAGSITAPGSATKLGAAA